MRHITTRTEVVYSGLILLTLALSGCRDANVISREQLPKHLEETLSRVDYREVISSLPEEQSESDNILIAYVSKSCRSSQIIHGPNESNYSIFVIKDAHEHGPKLASGVSYLDPKLLPGLPDNLFLQGSFALAIDKTAGRIFLTRHPATSWKTLINACENIGTDLSPQWKNL